MSQIDWSAVRKSLSPNELGLFNWLCGRIRHDRMVIEIVDGFRVLARKAGSKLQCELHWQANCYTCSPLSSLDTMLRKAQKDLNSARWSLRNAFRIVRQGFAGPRWLREPNLILAEHGFDRDLILALEEESGADGEEVEGADSQAPVE